MDIEFRGRRVDNGDWVYGDYVRLPKDPGDYWNPPSQELDHFITNKSVLSRELVKVIPATVGQYIGRKDSKGRKIYLGDYVMVTDTCNDMEFKGVVDFIDSSFVIRNNYMTAYRWMDYDVEIIKKTDWGCKK